MEEDKSIGIMTLSNQSEPMLNWTGTIEVGATIGEAFKSKVTVNMIDAITAAHANVGANSTREGSRVDSSAWIFSIQDEG